MRMKLWSGRTMTVMSIATAVLLFLIMTVMIVFNAGLTSDVDDNSVSIEGVYSADGGEWTPTLKNGMVKTEFKELTIKGRFTKLPLSTQKIIIGADNAWFRLKADGKVIATNYRADNGVHRNTPGYSIIYAYSDELTENSEIELYVMYPYKLLSTREFGSLIDIYVGDHATLYELLFMHKGISILLCILICFFGLFAFPIAGVVLGKINFRYLAFALLCFFAGQFILAQELYSYFPLLIDDPVRSMAACNITTYFCLITALVYIKVCLKVKIHKLIGNITILSASALSVASLALHFTGMSDLYAAKPYMLLFSGVCALILAVCVIREAKKDAEMRMLGVTMIPLLLGLWLDSFNDFYTFTTLPIFETGMALTLLNQVVMLVMDMKRQYNETLRYQQMQKELYEAKVSLMVSQIQPHFLYNSLTSIAMMCTKDPKTAKKATINFADYLRGNMNSLKQKAPVPFTQELEHLKKYLMLEEMRFGELLHIEYDIQTTDFEIPMLTVQPLVENAVKHGVGMKEDGGTVTIATRETADAYEVIVSDDGVGFDTSKPIEDDGRSHVGMENVKQRLKELCSADVIIESTVGVGTTATIRIPKKTEELL